MIPYKLAKVYNGDKEWFVEYSYWSLANKKYVRKKVRLGQKGLGKKDRQELLEELRDQLNVELRKRNKNKEYHKAESNKKHFELPLVEGLRQLAGDKNIEPSRCKIYSELSSKLKDFYKEHPVFENTYTDEVDEIFLSNYVAHMKKKGLASKSINKHLWGLQAAGEKFGVEISTAAHRVKLIKNETGKYPPLTHQEKEIAFSYFKPIKPGLHMFHLHQYYTCIRPAELHRLRIKWFDLNRETVYLPWIKTKNGLSAHVQLLPPLLRALKEYGIDKLPGEWFLFGRYCEPSPEEYKGNWAGDTWADHRERMGMPKEKQSYGFKHTFNRDYVENNKGNIDWEFLRRHNRHATIQQTQEYIAELTAYFLDKGAVILDYTQKK